jgi:hypothetical protein
MNPDVADAVGRLAQSGVLSPDQAASLGRVARGEVVSVRAELRLLHYAGVLAVTAGVGLLVQQNLDRIGPVAIACALWAAAIGALVWAARHLPRFSWGESPSTHLAFDYILLLAVLLTGAALGYVEVQFTPLGPGWRHHLLLVAVLAGVLAVRGDSKLVASVALSTFAAWRGVSASLFEHALWGAPEAAVRANAFVVGLAFVTLGHALVRTRRKPHFEPVPTYLGWLLMLSAIVAGLDDGGAAEVASRAALFAVGLGLAAFAFRAGRFPLFGIGLVAAYVGLSALVLADAGLLLGYVWFAVTGVAVLVTLLKAHHALREQP